MHEDEGKESFVDVGFCGGWAGIHWRFPVGEGETCRYDGMEGLDGLFGV